MNRTAATARRMKKEWPLVYGAVVVLAAAIWLHAMMPFLSPIIAYIVFLVLLRPFAGSQRYRLLVGASSVVMVLWLFASLGSILAPFIVAFVIAYILHPLADRLERRGMPRSAAVAILTVPILVAIVLSIVFGVPAIVAQVESLITRIPEAVQRLAQSLDNLRARIATSHLPFVSGQHVAAQLTVDQAKIEAFLQQQQAEIVKRAWSTVLGVGKGLSFLLTIIGYLVLTPVLIIYLLKDFNGICSRARELMPVDRRERWLAFFTEFDNLLSRFLRGQLIEAILVGILTWLGLMILNVPYAGLVGVVAGVFNLIPYLGLVVSIIPVLIIALLSGSFVSIIARAGIVFFIVQLIDGSITGPRIVGGSIGIHPVVVILALAVGSFFFGFVGLLLAMPAAILIKLLARDSIARYKKSALYRGAIPADTE
jgi:predicted PurR-regulated permease PerM